ncbi:TFIIB-type zinc ribbon-containing protein [Haloechinothrix halophila]|uniref:Transcription factor zinc-finger domain-containing protein n=1 Tax=Haloechinothrix halophila YIM 93223 TaxID=592678 RepID=W9DSC4_9PSEU|nr:zf-TFIIB domain-containing protein [Haloechinothrix halophila]ETA66552.1 hypothetical protein AmyhaDRAFT_0312 [Haloechinothrix halophila YIM 93223]
MICPKCQNLMKTVDKDGVHIEQCEGCGGVFLDRGEMEQVARAEAAFYAGAAGGASAAPPPYNPSGPAPGQQPQQMPPQQPTPPTRQMPGYGYGDSPKPYKGGYKDSPKPYRGGYRDSPKPYGHGQYGHRKRKGNFLENLFDF